MHVQGIELRNRRGPSGRQISPPIFSVVVDIELLMINIRTTSRSGVSVLSLLTMISVFRVARPFGCHV